jgi:hypothetical protein
MNVFFQRIFSKCRGTNGQTLLIPAVILLMVLVAFIPTLVSWVQSASKATVKTVQNTRAEELAEAALDLGFQKLVESSTTWNAVMSGAIPSGFQLDTAYSDLGLGVYAVRLSSGPGPQQATLLGVGRDKSKNEVWAIRQVVQNVVSQTAMYILNGSSFTNQANVEWGPIISFASFNTDAAHTFPRMTSDGSISPWDLTAAVPNTDNVQWWAYATHLPPAPLVDTDGYAAAAQAAGAGHYNTGLAPYHVNIGATSGTYFYDGDAILDPTAPLYINGNLIVMGNLTILGNVGLGSPTEQVPPTAWLEYGNAWNYYRTTWDTLAPLTFPGENGAYVPSGLPNVPLGNVVVHGFVYVQKQLIVNDVSGVHLNFSGAMLIGQSSNLSLTNAAMTLYFDPAVAQTVKTRNVSLSRLTWKNVANCSWSGTLPACL